MDSQIILIENIFSYSELLRHKASISNTAALYSKSLSYLKTSTIQVTTENQAQNRNLSIRIVVINLQHTSSSLESLPSIKNLKLRNTLKNQTENSRK